MQADYARKTDLTEAEASLQSQISQNAAQIASTVSKVEKIDETANNAQEQAASARAEAEAAQAKADQATTDAQAAQTAADNAAQAAANAQSEADTAKAAAATAKSVADKAEADLKAAQDDLATVSSRVDATEEEIAAAQQAVTTAQTAADKAKTDAQEAATKAAQAQSTADTAVTNAANAKSAADDAAEKADLAQATADAAKGDAQAAQTVANEAKAAANAAQSTADTAKTNAENAQAKANQAATDAANAQKAAEDADARAAQAEADLATAQQNLADVTSRVDATAEEVEAAKSAVVVAKAAADKAQEEAEAAQAEADEAKANAATAQTVANNAKTAADNAQAAADEAQQAADEAQSAVDALAVRVTTAETKITQNSEEIALRAKKTEVAETLGGYYTKNETDAAFQVKADEITSTVRAETIVKPIIRGQKTQTVTVQNALQNSISGLTLYGRTTQNGTPTPNAPVALEIAGDGGNVTVNVNAQSMIISTPNGLPGIKLVPRATIGGNYIDANGDEWLCDEIDFARGKYIRRVGIQVFDGSADEGWSTFAISGGVKHRVQTSLLRLSIFKTSAITDIPNILSTMFVPTYAGSGGIWTGATGITVDTLGNIYCYTDLYNTSDVSLWTAFLAEHPMTVLYQLATPIETDLTAEQIATFNALGNPAGTFTVTSEACLSIELSGMASNKDVETMTGNAQASADAANTTAGDALGRVTVAESEIKQLAEMIAMLVTDGNGASLMTQTASGWTFNIGEIISKLNSTAQDVDGLNEDVSGANDSIGKLQQAVNDLGVKTDYVTITTYNGQPCIELGERDNNFKLRITNTEIQFADGTTIPAYVSNKKLMIEQAEVKDELQFGGFVWKIRSSGNMGVLWKGVSS
jgi:hypothetical protein